MPRWCMPRRRPATITQADVRRIIRGAQQAGAKSVEIRIGEKASVVVRLGDLSTAELAPREEIVL